MTIMSQRPQRDLSDRILDPSETALAWALLSPALLFIAVIVAYPVATLIVNSFFDIRLSRGLPTSFIGFDNYAAALTDSMFWRAIKNTLIITFVTVPGALVVGLGLAMLANMPFRFRGPIRLALLLPWALPLAFVGLIFAWFFHSEYGIINDLIRRFGGEPQIWFNSPGLTMMAICIATIWKTSSFMALILLAGLQTIPSSLYEAAEVDGASKWTQFTEITLPLLVPSMLVALIFRTLTAIQSFIFRSACPVLARKRRRSRCTSSSTRLIILISATAPRSPYLCSCCRWRPPGCICAMCVGTKIE